jgi:hypothetical protein
MVPASELSAMPAGKESRELGRGTYKAYRLSGWQVAIVAEGVLPNFNDRADLAQSPLRIFPPRFELFFIHQTIRLPTTRPFRIVEIFGYPSQQATLVVIDADGPHTVQIKDVGAHSLTPSTDANTQMAFSTESIQSAFDAAVAQFSPPTDVADLLATFTLKRAGKLEGGIVGFRHYFAEVELTT